MGTITLRLPDDIHHGIKVVATQRKMSINKLYEDISSSLLRGYNAEMRFRKRAAEGNPKRGLAVLDQLDKHFVANQK
ncbi:MAG: CopG family transcriptional regulator [Desulfobacteraceae bacterium 4572_87]|nr:MAG: CopG family transcriptional regulator [Desulfobacteraceae bacterium 4572_87]